MADGAGFVAVGAGMVAVRAGEVADGAGFVAVEAGSVTEAVGAGFVAVGGIEVGVAEALTGWSLGSPGNVSAWISTMLVKPSPSESRGSMAAIASGERPRLL